MDRSATNSNHHSTHVGDSGGSGLLLTCVLNLIIPVVQLIGGIWAHSTALISDAIHNFSDFTAVLIAYFAFLIGKKSPSASHTFGYKRAEILAALANVVILTGASAVIVYEAVNRFRNPSPIIGKVVIWMAVVGIFGNGFSAYILYKDSKHSLNIRGAFLHMLGDLGTSVAVLASGLVLLVKPWYWIDPALSLLIVAFIVKNCWKIMKEAGIILMNATPAGLDIKKVKESLGKIPGVCSIHYIHAWNISVTEIAFSCHVVVADQTLSQTGKLKDVIRRKLLEEFAIVHPTLQFETTECGNGGMLCEEYITKGFQR